MAARGKFAGLNPDLTPRGGGLKAKAKAKAKGKRPKKKVRVKPLTNAEKRDLKYAERRAVNLLREKGIVEYGPRASGKGKEYKEPSDRRDYGVLPGSFETGKS